MNADGRGVLNLIWDVLVFAQEVTRCLNNNPGGSRRCATLNILHTMTSDATTLLLLYKSIMNLNV